MGVVLRIKTPAEQIADNEKNIDALKSNSAIFIVTGMCPPFGSNADHSNFTTTPYDNAPFNVERGEFTASGDKRRPESSEEILLKVIPREILREFLRGEISEEVLRDFVADNQNKAPSDVSNETLNNALDTLLQGVALDEASGGLLNIGIRNDVLDDVRPSEARNTLYARFLRTIPENAVEERPCTFEDRS